MHKGWVLLKRTDEWGAKKNEFLGGVRSEKLADGCRPCSQEWMRTCPGSSIYSADPNPTPAGSSSSSRTRMIKLPPRRHYIVLAWIYSPMRRRL